MRPALKGIGAAYGITAGLVVGTAFGAALRNGNTFTTTYQGIKTTTGLGMLVPSANAAIDNYRYPEQEFFKPIPEQPTNIQFSGIDYKDHAALMYSAFYRGEPKPVKVTDLSPEQLQKAKEISQDINKISPKTGDGRFQLIDTVKNTDTSGLKAVAYLDKCNNSVHIFVVGMETDNIWRDTLPDYRSIAFDGMRTQTKELHDFVSRLNKQYPGQLASITGQSMGTIAVSKVAYDLKDAIPMDVVLYEPRMGTSLADELFDSNSKQFQDWYGNNTVGILAGANAWNNYHIQALGEGPSILNHQNYVITKNGAVIDDKTGIILTLAGPHRASTSVEGIALETLDLIQIDPKSKPVNAAETLRANGADDIAFVGALGVSAFTLSALSLATAAGTTASAYKYLKDELLVTR